MGFDFTSFVFEIVNFVVLVWLLSRFVYRPLKKSIEDRRAEQTRLLDEARELRASSERERETLLAEQREIAALRERIMNEATEDAASARARLLAEATDDAATIRARAEKKLEVERSCAEAWVRDLAVEESTRIAARLLAELSPRAIDDALIDRLVRAVRAAALPARREPRRHAPEVELRFARPPAPRDVERLRAVFLDALGVEPLVTTQEDSSLVAGVVAKVDDHVLDASIAGNLTVLAARARELASRSPDA